MKAQAAGSPEAMNAPNDLAWRVHDNAKGWIAQVDVKATAALAIEAAVLGFTFAIITNAGAVTHLTSPSRWVLGGGFLVLLVSIVLSTLVLLPRLKLREPKVREQSYLYFGHLRHWDKNKLSATLARNQVNDAEIADQVIKMSEIAWRKHVLLQWSLYLLLAGIFVIGGLYLLLVLGVLPTSSGIAGGVACP